MAINYSYTCSSCGAVHNELPFSYGADAPYWYDLIAPEEQETRATNSSDQCIVDETNFFIRGCLEIPVIGVSEKFTWGVWTSLSEANFMRASELWDNAARIEQPAYFGWLSTRLPGYPDTLNLKTMVHTRPLGQRALVELEPTSHPLAVEQREGITVERVRQIAELILHGSHT